MEPIPAPESLVVGNINTREDLKYLFTLANARIEPGVHRPRENQSRWLFITDDKTHGRRHYRNTLGNVPVTLILNTLLLSPENRQPFLPTDNSPQPESANDEFGQQASDATEPGSPISDQEFDAQHVEDERKKVLRSIVRRQGQSRFRKALICAYQGQCAITGCTVTELLEAAHIHPYMGEQTNKVTNGLLLRADIHTLFDLGLIHISPASLKVLVSGKLKGTEYESLHQKSLNLPLSTEHHPNREALQWHADHARGV